MKYYSYVEPDENMRPVEIILSEQDIIDQYWEYWSTAMKKVNKEDLITRKNCIEDFCIVNWANEINDNN